jgi:hypothetical protein
VSIDSQSRLRDCSLRRREREIIRVAVLGRGIRSVHVSRRLKIAMAIVAELLAAIRTEWANLL